LHYVDGRAASRIDLVTTAREQDSLGRDAPSQSYDRIAVEYYDAARHPTCADFRDASRMLLMEFLAGEIPGPRALELGAGKSLLAECFAARGFPLETLTITDASATMLAYSEPWRARGATLAVASVDSFEAVDASFDLIASCLGDPYNTPALWRRITHWLAPGGACFYTTPSFAWAERFRPRHQSGREAVAEFLVDGESIYVPSWVLRPKAQCAMIEAAGLRVEGMSVVTRRDLPSGARSMKLDQPDMAADLPILTAFCVRQPR
jgi:2-polyprenyl-3-methyl-5-hydroxy-6-metoxy-1,4-benzoquinol methylase